MYHFGRCTKSGQTRPADFYQCQRTQDPQPRIGLQSQKFSRSVSHLLAVIEQLEATAVHCRRLRDPIDTTIRMIPVHAAASC